MVSFINGKVLKDEDFLVELEKLDKLNRQKAVVKLDRNTDINEIFNTLANMKVNHDSFKSIMKEQFEKLFLN